MGLSPPLSFDDFIIFWRWASHIGQYELAVHEPFFPPFVLVGPVCYQVAINTMQARTYQRREGPLRFRCDLIKNLSESLSLVVLDINEEIIRRTHLGVLVQHGQHIHLHQAHGKDQHDAHTETGDDGGGLVIWPHEVGHAITADHGTGRRQCSQKF